MAITVGESHQQSKSELFKRLLQLARAIFPLVEADLRITEEREYTAPIAGLRAVIEHAPLLLPYTPHVGIKGLCVYLKLQTKPKVRLELGDFYGIPEVCLRVEPTEEELENLCRLLPRDLREYFKHKGVEREILLTWLDAAWPTEPSALVFAPRYIYLPHNDVLHEFVYLPRDSTLTLLEALEKLLGSVVATLRLVSRTYIRYYNAEKNS